MIGSLELVEIMRWSPVRAAERMPTEPDTLGALHLVTALWREMTHLDVVTATHDVSLGLATRLTICLSSVSGRADRTPLLPETRSVHNQ